jgi:uncharacterized protein
LRNKQAEIVKGMKDKQILFHLYATQGMLIIISIIVGFILFPDFSSFLELWTFDLREILIFGGVSAFVVIILDFAMMKYVPKHYYDDGGINELVFKKRSIPHIFILCLLIAFTEELLFRGIIQTYFGIIIASLVFAVLHVRYLYKWVLFTSVIVLSFLLGYLYLITDNLYVTFFAHFLIDLVFAIKIRIDYVHSLKG